MLRAGQAPGKKEAEFLFLAPLPRCFTLLYSSFLTVPSPVYSKEGSTTGTFTAGKTIGEQARTYASSKAPGTSWAQALQQPQLQPSALVFPQHHNKNIRDNPFSFTDTRNLR